MTPGIKRNTRTEPTISRHFVTSLCEAVNDDIVADGLRRFGFADLSPDIARVPFRPYIALFEWLAEKLHSPCLGLQISQQTGPETLGAIGYMFLGSPSLEMAIRNLGNYLLAVQDNSELYLGLDGEYAYVHYEILDNRIRTRRQDSEYSMGYVWHLMKLFSANSCKLTMVEFEHDRSQACDASYHRIFHAPTLFQRRFNRMHFRADQLSMEPQSGDPHLYPILEAQVRDVVDRAETSGSFADQVHTQLTPDALGSGMRAKAIAAQLGISESTLHRRLRLESTTFKQLFDDAAKSHAKYLIAQNTLQIGVIARRLGYAETACLTRAFYRWFDTSPSKYRASLKEQGYVQNRQTRRDSWLVSR